MTSLHAQLVDDARRSEQILGDSPEVRRLRSLIERVAPTDGRVLITGENGTGKELVAAAIHWHSRRRDAAFVKLNCSAVPAELVESELFGHEKGAFTGALATRKGRFELADGGTLFLDEVGDMPPAMQVKLLRVLQEGEFERVGGSRTIRVDTRVVSATNRDLKAMISGGSFREDLFYRLNVVSVTTPPLRERAGDIGILAQAFAERAAWRARRGGFRFSEGALRRLSQYEFPGNIRELHNLIERLVILVETDVVESSDIDQVLPPPTREVRGQEGLYQQGETFASLSRAAERRILVEAILAHGGNKSAAARSLELDRSHFHKKCRQLGIVDSEGGSGAS